MESRFFCILIFLQLHHRRLKSLLLLLPRVHFHHLFTSSFLICVSNLFLIIPLHLRYLLVHPVCPSVSTLSFSVFSIYGGLVLASTWLFFLRWPCSQAAGLYLVQPMIKSAGLTSASDRPIHPTDTPPPPHMGRLNNLCTISNMKEDLLTLQSPPAPFPISTDC